MACLPRRERLLLDSGSYPLDFHPRWRPRPGQFFAAEPQDRGSLFQTFKFLPIAHHPQ